MIPIVTTPQILTESIYVAYGGATGTATSAQLQAAFAMAESQAQQYIGTFLTPTTVTGTYSWPPLGQPLELPYTHVSSVQSVIGIHDAGCNCADDSIELSGCAWILDGDGGIISVEECGNTIKASCSGCRCWGYRQSAFQARVVFVAGLPTSAASDPRLLQGLTIAAQMALNQMIDPMNAEGGAGNPGIQSFRSLTYSETRAESSYKHTAFGASALANYVADMLEVFRYNRAFKVGW